MDGIWNFIKINLRALCGGYVIAHSTEILCICMLEKFLVLGINMYLSATQKLFWSFAKIQNYSGNLFPA